ncbi:hypothetical protein F0562_000212 [Nyssa sinensis]|uniref:Beta-amylase n=1 Tax=Nyssa sinensis TaxID=561372 RepID=A0A5J5C4J6_9ASTE|nr:hypothetical protein F0562_000212 [Nyssa sinensis]
MAPRKQLATKAARKSAPATVGVKKPHSSGGRTIIFTETKDSASQLDGLLPGARALHGYIQQAQREAFKIWTVSVIGSSQGKLGRTDFACRDVGLCNNLSAKIFCRKSKICFDQRIRWPEASIQFTIKAAAPSEAVVSEKVSGGKTTSRRRSKRIDGVRLYVGLPMDAVSDCNTINHARAIASGLKALKLLGVDGQLYKDCLSLAVDDLPVLDGKTPIQVYKEFCESFKSSFLSFMDSTITGISVGLGPDGELRYPSHRHPAKSNVPGVGEFQCYDKNLLSHLKRHAQAIGNPLWGLSGPHDAPNYDQFPNSNNFFKEHGGSWETAYGDFFLSWYSSHLISHGDRLLSLASSTFSDTPVTLAGKVPLMHSWYRTRSHASELTSGFYNTVNRDGYEGVAEMFGRNSCKMILPGMDLSDEHQPLEALSSPESLLAQITTACRKHGVEICGQNSSVAGVPRGFEQIKKNLLELHANDVPKDEEEAAESLCLDPGKDLHMQAA